MQLLRRFSIALVLSLPIAGCGQYLVANTPTPTLTPFQFVTATAPPSPTPTQPTRTARPVTATPTRTPTATHTPEPSATGALTATPATVTVTAVGGPCSALPEGIFRSVYFGDPGIAPSLGCPTAPPDSNDLPRTWPVEAIYQPFERGQMLWLSNVGWFESRAVHVLLDDSTYTRHDDTYDPGLDADLRDFGPPEGLFQPEGALGKVWGQSGELRERIGFATALPAQMHTTMQMFEYGEMVQIQAIGAVLVFKRGNPNSWSLIAYLNQ